MTHTAWIGDLTAAQRDTAFGTGEGRLGLSVLRIPVPENRADWSRDMATVKRAAELGATVFASPWNPPAHMVETFVHGGQTNARRLRHDMYGAYARHLNDFNGFVRNNGVNLYGISVQNEPDYAHDWTWWTPGEMVRFLRENAGSIGTRVIAPESFNYTKNTSDPILNDPAALANVDIVATHLYGTPFRNFPYPLFKKKGAGKELWMTEVYYPDSTSSADLWPQALDVAEHLHHAMVDAEFQHTSGGTSAAVTASCGRTAASASEAPAWRSSPGSSVRGTYGSRRRQPRRERLRLGVPGRQFPRCRRHQQVGVCGEPTVHPEERHRVPRLVLADRREPERRSPGHHRLVERLFHRHASRSKCDDLRHGIIGSQA